MKEQDMALKILFSKDVDLAQLSIADTVAEYNSEMDWSYRYLTKDEFNLLKKISENIIYSII